MKEQCNEQPLKMSGMVREGNRRGFLAQIGKKILPKQNKKKREDLLIMN